MLMTAASGEVPNVSKSTIRRFMGRFERGELGLGLRLALARGGDLLVVRLRGLLLRPGGDGDALVRQLVRHLDGLRGSGDDLLSLDGCGLERLALDLDLAVERGDLLLERGLGGADVNR